MQRVSLISALNEFYCYSSYPIPSRIYNTSPQPQYHHQTFFSWNINKECLKSSPLCILCLLRAFCVTIKYCCTKFRKEGTKFHKEKDGYISTFKTSFVTDCITYQYFSFWKPHSRSSVAYVSG